MTATATVAADLGPVVQKTEAELKLQVLMSFVKRFDTLSGLLEGDCDGYVLAWPQYSLGVLVTAPGKSQAVGVENAEVRSHKALWSSVHVYNGKQERAVAMSRRAALEAALVETTKCLRQFSGMAI